MSDEAKNISFKEQMMIVHSLAFNNYPNKAFFDTHIHDLMNAALKKS